MKCFFVCLFVCLLVVFFLLCFVFVTLSLPQRGKYQDGLRKKNTAIDALLLTTEFILIHSFDQDRRGINEQHSFARFDIPRRSRVIT